MKNLFVLMLASLALTSCAEKKKEEDLLSGGSEISCAENVTTNMTASAFEALIQNGTSPTTPFVICIHAGASVNAGGGGNINISAEDVMILGEDTATSALTNVNLTSGFTWSPSVSFVNLKINGVGAPAINAGLGDSRDASVSISDSVISSNSSGISLSAGNAGSANVIVSGTTITSNNDSVVVGVGNAGQIQASIEDSTFLTNAKAVSLGAGDAGILTVELGANTFKASGATSSASTAMTFSVGAAGITQIDNTSSTKHRVCNVSGSAHTFNQVYTSSGATASGSFSIANTLNTNNSTIGTCP